MATAVLMRTVVLAIWLTLTVLAIGCSRESASPSTPAATQENNKPAADKPAAAPDQSTQAGAAVLMDEFSYAQPNRVRIADLELNLRIDFSTKQISGTAAYDLDWIDQAATELVLDTRDLTINKVEAEVADGTWTPLQFALAPADKILGSKLTIQTPERPAKLRVTYTTSPQASGLQWLEASMTGGKRQPFMFSQSQQIHARSWVPLQDTPQVRFTHSAQVRAPADVMVLMSADNDPKKLRDGDYRFKMPQKIPSYLLAIAAGDLVFQPISARSGVWAEPGMAKKAAEEFADTERMIVTAEQLYGPYRWDRYDILVLPPSFPYGGMENPRLTFATPTVVVGDKSLVSLIAHELAHSWSGNLVTFATPKDGWLNEGFTSYVEGRLIEALYGAERAAQETVLGRNELAQEFQRIDPKLQVLSLKPGAVADPDGASSSTVYVKGAWFLQFLEQRFGRDHFDAFLRGYFDHYAFQSIPTTEFLRYTKANLLDKFPGKAIEKELEQWVYEPGIPDNAPQVRSRALTEVDTARAAWLDSGRLPSPRQTRRWNTQQWVHFIEGLPKTLKLEQLNRLDNAYKFTGTDNSEIAQRWYPLTVRSNYRQARPAIAEFLQRVGRRKLIMPVYEALVDSRDGLAFAKDIFAVAQPGYHPITTGSVQALIAQAQPAQKAQ